jgi:hypothetical protein
MSTDSTNTTSLTPIDGYDEDGTEASSRGAKYLKFDGATQSLWFLREDGTAFKKGPLYAPDCWEEHIKWIDKQPVERKRKVPGEAFPDVESLNSKAPKSEWREDFNGNPIGPWRHTFNVGLVDCLDGSRYIVSNSTTGMAIAYDELRERVQFMRKLRGERVVPVVELSTAAMKTKKFGTKQRPHFEIADWRKFGGSAPAIAGPAPNGGGVPGEAVAPLTAAEIIVDAVADISPTPKRVKKNGKAKAAKVAPAGPNDSLDDLGW